MPMTSDILTIEHRGHVGIVWLDRPDKHNAMGKAFWNELPLAIAELDQNEATRVVLLAGKGPSFSVGLDLFEFAGEFAQSATDSPASAAKKQLATIRHMQHTMTSVAECSKPVIAAIHGYCLGGGIDLITAADIRLASDDAVFSIRETKIAMVADVGTLQRLPRIVTAGHVAELAYTGKDISAQRAAEIGLVNHVYVDQEALMVAAWEMAEEIAQNSPLATQGIKQVLTAGEDLTTAEALEYVALYNTSFIRSSDLGEAMAAFMEKRTPGFTGE